MYDSVAVHEHTETGAEIQTGNEEEEGETGPTYEIIPLPSANTNQALKENGSSGNKHQHKVTG